MNYGDGKPFRGLPNPFASTNVTTRFDNFASEYVTQEAVLERLLEISGTIAPSLFASASANVAGRFPCLAKPGLDGKCVDDFVARYGMRMFRRPLDADEVKRYSDFILSQKVALGSDAEAVKAGIELFLVSPHFINRFEVGAGAPDASGRRRLGPYEIASSLAYGLTGKPPADELMKAAESGALGSEEGIAKAARTLLGEVSSNPSVGEFLRQYFQYDKALRQGKENGLDPRFKPQHAEADVQATDRFLATAAAADTNFIQTALTSTSASIPGEIRYLYNLGESQGTTPETVDLPASQRAGILTRPAFLMAFSGPAENNVILRGKYVSESLLCKSIPDLPPGVIPMIPDLGPDATLRERLKVHSARADCAACHKHMDPIGFGLEGYDPLGKRVEGMGAVDESGELLGTGGFDGPFNGGIELSNRLGKSSEVERCYIRHQFRYWMGRNEDAKDGCSLDELHTAHKGSGGKFTSIALGVWTTDAFLYRTAVE